MSGLLKQRRWRKKNWEDAIKNVFTISPRLPFAETLAAELLKRNDGNPLGLANTVVFLPTRRAGKTVREAFLRQSGGKPLLLPRLIPFGGFDGDTEISLSLTDGGADLPPPMPPLRRKLLLARLIQSKPTPPGMGPLTPEKALQLADALADFLDQAYIEEVPLDCFEHLVPEEFAAHWQDVVVFLETVTRFWPEILKEEGFIDAADRQARLFHARARLWRENPPDYPVIAAGSTGSQPAVADFLDAVASLPRGEVVLPGLDTISDAESLAQAEPSHPQYNMLRLLERMGVERTTVRPFGGSAGNDERVRLIAEAMRPAGTTEAWRTMKPFGENALKGVMRLDCDGAHEEALAIALILRQTLETPGKTAALVTPDRNLARRVIAEMNRWGITLDDSAGTVLTQTTLGIFLFLLAEAALSGLAPYELLAVLKHPRTAGGMEQGAFRALVRKLERTCLRGRRPGDGFDGLTRAADGREELEAFVRNLRSRTEEFVTLMQSTEARPLSDFLEAHLKAAESLADSADRSGAERLWNGDEGDAAAAFFNELKQEAGLLAPLRPAEYVSVLLSLGGRVPVRPTYGTHPRLDILGTIEARLLRPDVLILGGLNEGTWPAAPAADPWMSRPMRRECGLPSPERKTGLSAHDFAQGFCAPNVVLTRAMKEGGTPTVPSRWLMRLDAVLAASGTGWKKEPRQGWPALLDRPDEFRSIAPPAPTPPLDARPRRLSVTQVETWMRDPYSIYARHILNLKPLDEIDQDLNVADFGSLMHKILEEFCRRHPSSLPPGAEQEILELGRSLMETLNFSAKAAAFWRPRMERTLIWFVAEQRKRIGNIREILCEQKGSLVFPARGGDFRLFGFADRIDRMKDGTVVLIDYKTGTPPPENSVKNGYSPQLPLEAGMILHGGFENVRPDTVAAMEYWRLRGRNEGGEIKTLKGNAEERVGFYFKILSELIDAFDRPETPYLATPDPSISLKYADYDHLARLAEWAAADPEDRGEE
ncbi:MAG: double-strand break repair protein AddB [Alphaproteobacteria bacterium]|jgi:ATP-dependent helicase/nuclease subunit B